MKPRFSGRECFSPVNSVELSFKPDSFLPLGTPQGFPRRFKPARHFYYGFCLLRGQPGSEGLVAIGVLGGGRQLYSNVRPSGAGTAQPFWGVYIDPRLFPRRESETALLVGF